MKFILAAKSRVILKRFVLPPTLVALDFDGTLAPVVENRRRASLRPATRRLLAALSARYPCIVISGRARSDVEGRLRGTGIRTVIGNHGIEPWHASPAMERSVLGWLPRLRRNLARFPGVVIENKRFSIAVHYRNAVNGEAVPEAVQAMAGELAPVRIIGGKMVVNLLPFKAPHKGLAVINERTRSGCRHVIYVGDDDTDEDVFALHNPMWLMTIRIGAKRDSMADFYLRDQSEIDRLIHLLLELRQQ